MAAGFVVDGVAAGVVVDVAAVFLRAPRRQCQLPLPLFRPFPARGDSTRASCFEQPGRTIGKAVAKAGRVCHLYSALVPGGTRNSRCRARLPGLGPVMSASLTSR